MKVKICGLSTAEQVKTSISHGANFCGFILNYPKSHRFIQFEKAKELTNILSIVIYTFSILIKVGFFNTNLFLDKCEIKLLKFFSIFSWVIIIIDAFLFFLFGF